jgi:hypothetical protein
MEQNGTRRNGNWGSQAIPQEVPQCYRRHTEANLLPAPLSYACGWGDSFSQILLKLYVVPNAPAVALIDSNVLRSQLYSAACAEVFNGHLTLLHAMYCNLRSREQRKTLPMNAWMQLCEVP